MKPVYVQQNPTLSSRIHEEKGKALCGDNVRPSIYTYIHTHKHTHTHTHIYIYIYIYIYMTWYQRLNRLSDLHEIRFRNSLQEAF